MRRNRVIRRRKREIERIRRKRGQKAIRRTKYRRAGDDPGQLLPFPFLWSDTQPQLIYSTVRSRQTETPLNYISTILLSYKASFTSLLTSSRPVPFTLAFSLCLSFDQTSRILRPDESKITSIGSMFSSRCLFAIRRRLLHYLPILLAQYELSKPIVLAASAAVAIECCRNFSVKGIPPYFCNRASGCPKATWRNGEDATFLLTWFTVSRLYLMDPTTVFP